MIPHRDSFPGGRKFLPKKGCLLISPANLWQDATRLVRFCLNFNAIKGFNALIRGLTPDDFIQQSQVAAP